MAFGTHWEWRGFGVLSDALDKELRRLPALFPDSQVVTDRYLWSPGCEINFKLRFGDFKIKRCIETVGDGVSRWMEDPEENYSFPLEAAVFDEVAGALGIGCSPAEAPVASEEELLESLGAAGAGLRVIPVAKERWQYRAPLHGDGIVELAEISAPEKIISVSVEHETEVGVREIMVSLGLPGGLASVSYLEALEVWGQEGTFLG